MRSNTCIDKFFSLYTSKAVIEEALAECGAGYAMHEQSKE